MHCDYSYDKRIIFFLLLIYLKWNIWVHIPAIAENLFYLFVSLNDTLLEFVSCEQKLIEVCIALKVCPLYNRQIIFFD